MILSNKPGKYPFFKKSIIQFILLLPAIRIFITYQIAMQRIFSLFLLGWIFSTTAFAQLSVKVSTGRLLFRPVSTINLPELYKQQLPADGKHFVVLQFNRPLTALQRETLTSDGITVLEYIPPFAYTAIMAKESDKSVFQRAGITGIAYMPASLKISNTLQHPERLSWLQGNNGLTDILVKISGIETAAAVRLLRLQQIPVGTSNMESYGIIQVRIPLAKLNELAAQPYVAWVEPLQPEPQTLNSKSRNMSAGNVAQASVAAGGYGLTGAGVVAGVGDDADPSNHIDLQDRIINRSPFLYNDHGTHVSGTVGGAGIVRYLSRGFAPAVKIVSQLFNGIWQNAGSYVQDFGMMATNNSYGNITGDADYEGYYDLYSQVLDQQAFQYPELLHVFASGNDGNILIPPFPLHYGNIISSMQSAKNVITVGRTDRVMLASYSSSSGPVKDGRLKPELMAIGEEIISPIGNGGYASAWGTSMAAPAITGGAVLLCEQYRKQFNSNPKSALLKALLMNGGLDIGITGPDFRHGYGMMNLQRSLDMLKNNHFYENSITTNGVQTQTITVPANTAQLKVMLYWHDPAASLYAMQTLVNDLDVEIVDPSGNTVQPQHLDASAAGVTNPATTGFDHINNNEQVIINNPVAGNYTIRVHGFAVNVNTTQPYFIAYDWLPRGLQIYAPFETDPFFPGELMVIHWADNGTPANRRTLEYSLDDGASWNLISDTVLPAVNYYNWNIPAGATASANARIRITENGTPFSNISGRFVLLGEVYHSFAPAGQQCEGYCNVTWLPVPGATDYEVLMKQGYDMQSVGTTTANNYTISGLNKDSVYWISVRARINGKPGRRSDGQSYQPNVGNCTGSISDNDLQLVTILSPNTGRKFSVSELGSNSTVSIQIKNLDDASVAAYDVKYSINGAAFSSQHITTPLAGGSTAIINFPGINLAAEGTYQIVAVVKNVQPDVVTKNDTLRKTIKQLSNAPVIVSNPFIENFETADSANYENAVIGLNGLDRWDFAPLTDNGDTYGRARTFVNTGIAIGSRAITVDVRKYVNNASLGNSKLTGTFNLANYNAATDEIRFDFMYKQHGSYQEDATVGKNMVSVRGTENTVAVNAYSLYANQPAVPGQWQRSQSIELSDLLANAGQGFSPTTQIIFGQTSALGMGDNTHFGGYTFDDIRIYTVANDMQAIAIDTPAVNNCGLGTVPVRIKIKNSMSYAINNIPVKLQVDNNTVITETISTVAPNTIAVYNFSALANVSAAGSHIIAVWTDLPADNFHSNDTIRKTIVNQPVVTSFPYLQDFENGNGNFYTGGKNSSWEYGTPYALKIKTAASGSKAWKTGLLSGYNDDELSYLYSPCFNTAGLTNPTLSFAMAYDLEYCRPDACDGAWVEYSTDGVNWNKLGSSNTGTNWYNNTTNQFWDSAKTHWHVATAALPAGAQNLRLRFVVFSDIFTGKDGVAIDDIHIYDKAAGIYDSNFNSNLITQNVAGSNAYPFTQNGKLIATLFPNGNTLGNTGVRAYINNGPIRNDAKYYYAARNLTVQPTTLTVASPVTVRFYFLDNEVDSLRTATGCPACTLLKDYTYIGITKYDDADDSKENGTMTDNQNGVYARYNSAAVRKIPYEKGYYAEVNINSFSELWLNDGTPANIIIPIQWLGFTAEKRTGSQVLLQWVLQNENNALQYEVELLQPNSGGLYRRLAVIPAINQQPVSTYTFTDSSTPKRGVYQYRIKRTDRNGQISYSEVRTLLFGDKNLNVLVYPNPATTAVQILLQSVANSDVQLSLYDATGKLLQQQHTTATGTAQKLQLNIAGLPAGVYQLQLQSGNEEEAVKVVKN